MKISVIIPVRDRFDALKRCLESIIFSDLPDDFEINIIDDGSKQNYDSLMQEMAVLKKVNIRWIKQEPLGISAARNRGAQAASNAYLLYIDSDCVVKKNCIPNLIKSIVQYPRDECFQLNLSGSMFYNVGKMEDLRLNATQKNLLNKDGYINYLNTAGFVIKKSLLSKCGYFNLSLKRGEDTYLLFKLFEKNILPRFLHNSRINHMPEKTTFSYITNHFKIGLQNSRARMHIRKTGILMKDFNKMKILRYMKDYREEQKIPRMIIYLTLLAYFFEICGRIVFKFSLLARSRFKVLSTYVDPVSGEELVATIVFAASQNQSMVISYLTAWSLVLSNDDNEFNSLLSNCDLCYADGMGVVLTAFLTSFKLLSKVTMHDYYEMFFKEISHHNLKIALVGGLDGIAQKVSDVIKKEIVLNINICFTHTGYIKDKEKTLIELLKKHNPNIIILSMGQPIQERLGMNIKHHCPDAVIVCLGAFFEFLIKHPKPLPLRLIFLRRIGLEWFWRLIMSPKRLWKRYLFGLPLLGFNILKFHIKRINKSLFSSSK